MPCAFAPLREISFGPLGRRWRCRRPLAGREAALLMRAVAKWLVLRLAAATQSDRRFAGGNRKGVARGIDHGKGAFDQKRTVVTNSNGDLRHFSISSSLNPFIVGRNPAFGYGRSELRLSSIRILSHKSIRPCGGSS